jgi:hypothetical protein
VGNRGNEYGATPNGDRLLAAEQLSASGDLVRGSGSDVLRARVVLKLEQRSPPPYDFVRRFRVWIRLVDCSDLLGVDDAVPADHDAIRVKLDAREAYSPHPLVTPCHDAAKGRGDVRARFGRRFWSTLLDRLADALVPVRDVRFWNDS